MLARMSPATLLSLLLLTLVNGMPDNKPRQNAGTNCGIRGQTFSSCLGSLGDDFCSSFLAQQTVALSTTTTFVTSILSTSTITASPPVTTTINGVITITSTSTFTRNITSITGTDTTFVAVATVNATTTSTVYTCAIPTAGPSFLNTSASAESTSIDATASLSLSILDQTSTILEDNVRRQAQTSTIILPPACFASYTARYPGPAAISTPCRNCYSVPFPTPAIITIPTSTVTSTLTAVILAAFTPTINVTSYSTALATTTVALTTSVNGSALTRATSTVTRTVVATYTTAWPAPTNINIFYTNETGNSTIRSYGRASNVTGGSGTFMLFGAGRDTFSVDSLGRLDDLNEPGEFLATNPQDRYPFVFLVGTASVLNTPTCIGCNGTLICNYPGDDDDTFAVCDDVLALGPAKNFDNTECSVISLQYE